MSPLLHLNLLILGRSAKWLTAGSRIALASSPCREPLHKMTKQIDKTNIIEDNRSHEKDTGSSEVQIALPPPAYHTLRNISKLIAKTSSRRGLLMMAADGENSGLSQKNRPQEVPSDYRKARFASIIILTHFIINFHSLDYSSSKSYASFLLTDYSDI